MPSDTVVVLLSMEKLLKDSVIKLDQLNVEQLTTMLNMLHALNRLAASQLRQNQREP